MNAYCFQVVEKAECAKFDYFYTFVLGAMYIGQCALKPAIPYLLMAFGIVAMVQMLKWSVENVILIKSGKDMETHQNKPPDIINIFQWILFFGMFAMCIYCKYFCVNTVLR